MKDELKDAFSLHSTVLRPMSFLIIGRRFRTRTFILHPSAFILVLLMSAQKLLNVLIVSASQAFVGAAEDNFSVTHHDYFAVD